MAERGLYVQAVLPAATRTEIWARSGKNIDEVPGVMEVGELVDAALLGFDRKEKITIPPLHDEKQWNDFDALRGAMLELPAIPCGTALQILDRLTLTSNNLLVNRCSLCKYNNTLTL